MDDRVLYFAGLISALSIGGFILGTPEVLGFSAQNWEAWQVFTFAFSHFSLTHLLENVVGMFLVSLLAREVGLRVDEVAVVYLVSVAIAVPVAFVFPGALIAGTSTGVYGILAASVVKGRKIIPHVLSLCVIGILIFSMSVINYISGVGVEGSLRGDMFHFSGFAMGAFAEEIEKKVIR